MIISNNAKFNIKNSENILEHTSNLKKINILNLNFDSFKKNNIKLNNIDGWFTDQDKCIFDFLLSLQNTTNITGNLLELGIWRGCSLFKILSHCNVNEILYGIDHGLQSDILNKEKYNFNNYNQLQLIKAKSEDISKYQIKNIRFVHIDACHRGSAVYNDIINANIYTNNNAILILDDFAVDYLGVMQAYYKAYFNKETKFIPFLKTDRKLYLCTNDYYSYYYNNVLESIVNFINHYDLKNMFRFFYISYDNMINNILNLADDDEQIMFEPDGNRLIYSFK